MEASYDPEADAAYVRVGAPSGAVHTDMADDGTVIDVDDESGDVLGYELLSVRSSGLGAFQSVLEAGRGLVAKAMATAEREGRPVHVSDEH